RHRDAEQADGEPDLHQLPCRQARPAAVGARAGGRGLHALPFAARRGAPCPADDVAADAVPAMPLAGRPSVGGAHARWAARRRRPRVGVPGRRQLPQLPLAGARVQPSRRRQADAMRTEARMNPWTSAWRLAALGTLSLVGMPSAWAADPSQWT